MPNLKQITNFNVLKFGTWILFGYWKLDIDHLATLLVATQYVIIFEYGCSCCERETQDGYWVV